MTATLSKCVVCYTNIIDIVNREEFTISSLESQLNVIFVLKNIFELRPNQLQEYLHLGNPQDWVKICKRCEKDIVNVRVIYGKLQQISRELDIAKYQLQERIRNSQPQPQSQTATKFKKNGDRTNVLHYCRDSFCRKGKLKEPLPNVNPFLDGDLMASHLALTWRRVELDVEPEPVQVKFEESVVEVDPKNLEGVVGKDQVIPMDLHCNGGPENSENLFLDKEDNGSNDGFSDQNNIDLEYETYSDIDVNGANDNSRNPSSKNQNQDPSVKEKKLHRKCPVCKEMIFCLKPFAPFSEHLESCCASFTSSSSNDNDNLLKLECFFCREWSCLLTETRKYMEHIIQCDKGIPMTSSAPWSQTVIKCSLCYSHYFPYPEFPNHVLCFHRREYGCTRCPRRFSGRGSVLRRHWKTMHKDVVKTTKHSQRYSKRQGRTLQLPRIPWWCPAPSCHQEFSEEAARDAHIPSCPHQSEVPQKTLKCLWCDRKYYHEEELLMHRVIVHESMAPSPRIFKCDQNNCKVTCDTRPHLIRHQKEVHGLQNRYCTKCAKCGTEFQKASELKVHMNQVHGTEEIRRKTTCQVCGKCFPIESRLRKHMEQVHLKKRRVPPT